MDVNVTKQEGLSMAEICPTPGIERLLLSTDGSEYSEGAVRESIKLAKRCSCKLSVVSVIETNPQFEAMAPQVVEKTEKEARKYLEAVQERARKEGIDCNLIIHRGEDSYKYIVDEAVKNKISMIVMGKRGRTGIKRLMMGSVTARVIGHAPCSVLVVPHEAQVEFKSIVLAVDGSRYSIAAASEAIGTAKRNKSRLIIVFVVLSESVPPMDITFSEGHRDRIATLELEEAEKNVKAVKDAAQKEGVSAEGLILSGIPYEAIINIAEERKADLIMLGSHGKTGLEKLLVGSVAERVIVLSTCAVLVVKTVQTVC
jgi:nucleotide-binding universal stress UspA family protein